MNYANKKYTTGKGGILDYFNPESNGGKNFWSSPFAQLLGKLQSGVNYAADKPRVNFEGSNPLRNTPIAPLGSFGTAVAQDIINTPSNIFRSGRQIGEDVQAGTFHNPKTFLSDIGLAASPVLNIASLGVGSSLAKQAGKQSIKQLLAQGAKEGGLFGGLYGSAIGLETGRDINDNSEYLKNLGMQTGMGTALGLGLGAATPVVGRGVSKLLKGYKASPLASEAGFIKYGEDVGPKAIGDVLKNKKLPANKTTTIRDRVDEALTEMESQSIAGKFDPSKALPPLEQLAKVATDEEWNTFINIGLRGNRGSGQSLTKSWEYAKMVLDRHGAFKPNKQFEKDYLASLGTKEKPLTPKDILPNQKSRDDLPSAIPSGNPLKVKKGDIVVNHNGELQIVTEGTNGNWIKSIAIHRIGKQKTGDLEIASQIRLATPEEISSIKVKPQLPSKTIKAEAPKPNKIKKTVNNIITKAKDWKEELAQLDDEFTQELFNIKSSIDAKGYSTKQAWQILHGDVPVPKNLTKEVAAYDALQKKYLQLSGKENVGNIERYAHEAWLDDSGLMKVGDTLFDKISAKFKAAQQRTGRGEGYVEDPYFAANRYKEQTLNERFKNQIESEETGKSIDVIKKEEEIVNKINEAADDPKKFKEVEEKVLDDLIEKGEKEGKEIIDMDIDYSQRTQLFRDDARKFKIAGIWEESGFKAHRNADAYAGGVMKDEVIPALQKGDWKTIHQLIGRELPRFNAMRLEKYIQDGDIGTVEGILGDELGKKYRRDAINQITDYLSTHRFHGRLKEDIQRKAMDLYVLEKRRQDVIDSTLGHIRSMIGRAALGLNLRTSVNNTLEVKRAISLGRKEDYSEAVKFATNPKNVKGIIERYGVKVGKNVQDIIDTRVNTTTKTGKVIEKADQVIYGPFNLSESWKDAVFLRLFENEGKRQGLVGKDLVDFVMHRFDYYGHKYGEYGTLGLFTNKWAKTALQFAQYPMKEAGIYVDMVGRGIGNPIGRKFFGKTAVSKSEDQARKYLLKITGMNLMIYGALSGLYGASKEEVFGALPFNIQPSENGLQVNLSPMVSLAQDIGWGVINAKAEAERNGENLDYGDLLSRKARRTLATTVIPAGNQLINKTGIQNLDPTGTAQSIFPDSAISDMARGYNPTRSGNVRFLAPDDPVNSLMALGFGPYATDQAREYFNNNGEWLREGDTEVFKNLQAQNPDDARNFYNDYQQGLKDANDKDKLVADIIAGKKSPDALRGTGAEDVVVKGSNNNQASTISELISQKKAEDEKYSRIIDIKYGDKYKEQSDQIKQQILASEGFSQKDVADAEIKYIGRSFSVEQKANYISQIKNPDWVNLYENDIVSLSVLKELQRMGKINDANALWDKIKMSDPYYRQEALNKLKEGYLKDLIKEQKSYMKDILSQQTKNQKAIDKIVLSGYKPTKYKKVSGPSASIRNMLTSPSDYRLGTYKTVKVKF